MSGYGRNPSLQSFDPLAPKASSAAPPPLQAPTTAAPFATGSMSPDHVRFLQSQGFSMGMIHALHTQKDSFPVRIWILDNSSAMNVRDAHLNATTTHRRSSPVTRWDELQECVAYHSNLAATLNLPTRYALLNPVSTGAPQYFSMAQTGNLPLEQHVLRTVMSSPPSGPTPLSAQLNILKDYIASIAPQLVAKRQTVPIILATQGLPTDSAGVTSPFVVHEFIETLRSLAVYPVCIVLRLCTDDEKAFDFYNSLDAKLPNLALDALDDYYGEALELYLRNPWLTYGPALHRYREMGFRVAVLDALDERALTLVEVHALCQFLFGPLVPWPDPVTQWPAFVHVLHDVVSREACVWNPIRQTATAWIDVAQFDQVYRSPTVPPPVASFPPSVPNKAFPNNASVPPLQSTHPPPSRAPVPASLASTLAVPTSSELVAAIETTWAKQPPTYHTTKPLPELLATLSNTFALVTRHDHFEPTKLHPFSSVALTTGGTDVLKRAVRKIRFVLHPDRLPKDLTTEQSLLCRTVWDTISDAWDLHNSTH